MQDRLQAPGPELTIPERLLTLLWVALVWALLVQSLCTQARPRPSHPCRVREPGAPSDYGHPHQSCHLQEEGDTGYQSPRTPEVHPRPGRGEGCVWGTVHSTAPGSLLWSHLPLPPSLAPISAPGSSGTSPLISLHPEAPDSHFCTQPPTKGLLLRTLGLPWSGPGRAEAQGQVRWLRCGSWRDPGRLFWVLGSQAILCTQSLRRSYKISNSNTK